MGGPSSLLGSPSARSTHEDDRTTRPHCWCLQEEGRLILKGALCMDILPAGAVTLSPSRSRGLFVFVSDIPRYSVFTIAQFFYRICFLDEKIVSENLAPPSLYSTIGHRYALVLFQVVLGMKLDKASIKNLLFRIFSILWQK